MVIRSLGWLVLLLVVSCFARICQGWACTSIRSSGSGVGRLQVQRYRTTCRRKIAIASTMLDDVDSRNWQRPLSSYEILMSRTAPGSSRLALSHAAVFHLNRQVEEEQLVQALEYTIARHPMLRSAIAAQEGRKQWYLLDRTPLALAREIVSTTKVAEEDLEAAWQTVFDQAVNEATFPGDTPQWRLYNIVSPQSGAVWVFSMNHAIDDQQSVNILLQDTLEFLNDKGRCTNVHFPFPPSQEQGLLGGLVLPTLKTLQWTLLQTWNSIQNPAVLPYSSKAKLAKSDDLNIRDSARRKTLSKFFTLSIEETKALRNFTHARGITITQLLGSCMSLVSTLLTSESVTSEKSLKSKIRFLLSVSLRPFASAPNVSKDYTGGTVACASGAVDYLLDIEMPEALRNFLQTDRVQLEKDDLEYLIEIAFQHKKNSESIIKENQLVPESVRLFNIGMNTVDILKAVDIDANGGNLGRAYTCGVSNVGVVKFPFGNEEIRAVEGFYGTAHGRNGVLAQLSTMTLNERLCACLQFPIPILTNKEADDFLRQLQKLISVITHIRV